MAGETRKSDEDIINDAIDGGLDNDADQNIDSFDDDNEPEQRAATADDADVGEDDSGDDDGEDYVTLSRAELRKLKAQAKEGRRAERRIGNVVGARRRAETRLRQLEAENEQLREFSGSSQKAALEAKRDELKKRYALALEDADFTGAADIQSEMADVSAQLQQVGRTVRRQASSDNDDGQARQQDRRQRNGYDVAPPPAAAAPLDDLPPAAADWVERNPWFTDPTSAQDAQLAQQLENQLIEVGWEPNSQDLFDQLDVELRKRRPHLYQQRQAARPTVAGRNNSGRPPSRNGTQQRFTEQNRRQLGGLGLAGLDPDNPEVRKAYLKHRRGSNYV